MNTLLEVHQVALLVVLTIILRKEMLTVLLFPQALKLTVIVMVLLFVHTRHILIGVKQLVQLAQMVIYAQKRLVSTQHTWVAHKAPTV